MDGAALLKRLGPLRSHGHSRDTAQALEHARIEQWHHPPQTSSCGSGIGEEGIFPKGFVFNCYDAPHGASPDRRQPVA